MAAFDPNYLVCSFRPPLADYRDVFDELADGIYFANIFTDDFCERILFQVREFEDARKNVAPECANSMHLNAVTTKQLGIDTIVHSFVAFFDREISAHILPERLTVPIDAVHSYIVRYGQSRDQDLDLGFHVDDSFLTLNICLNDGFKGSELVFEGERCPIHVDTRSKAGEKVYIEHKKGSMVVHPGKNRHYVNQICSGERYNLIIWCQSSTEREGWFDALKAGECMDFCGMRS